MRDWFSKLSTVFRGRDVDGALREEIEANLELEVRDQVARGLPEETAKGAVGAVACCVLISISVAALAADWQQFRGPNRDGVSNEKGLLLWWPRGGPHLIWKTAGVGEGYSSATILTAMDLRARHAVRYDICQQPGAKP